MGQRAIVAVSSLRARAGSLASVQLREAAEGLVADALGRLEGRLRGAAGATRSVERMREVLERDRALAFANQAAAPLVRSSESPAQAEPTPAPLSAPVGAHETGTGAAPEPDVCNEPIRTRTFAQLLATQGHVQRALAIYAYLLEKKPDDAALMAEATALRATQEGFGTQFR